MQYPLAAITDGTSNTIMFGETGTPDTLPNAGVATLQNAKVQGRLIMTVPLNTTPANTGAQVIACRDTAKGGVFVGSQSLRATWGCRWLDARFQFTGMNTIIGPNGASCAGGGNQNDDQTGILTASSYHTVVLTWSCSTVQ